MNRLEVELASLPAVLVSVRTLAPLEHAAPVSGCEVRIADAPMPGPEKQENGANGHPGCTPSEEEDIPWEARAVLWVEERLTRPFASR
jgi:hypothetical protein